jgi:alpha-galactosidase
MATDTDDLTIGYVGGGSRGWARTMMNDLAQQSTLHGEVRLYDVDHESAQQNADIGALIQSQDGAESEWTYTAVESLGEALSGADVVVLSTQDPPAETMAKDLEIPQEYGVYQTVGDTVGPGGAFRAMRAIPQYREIAAGVREHCPDAWVLNYTNPMTLCTRTLYAEYPDINAMGLCHEVYHAKDYIAGLAEEHFDVEGLDRHDISVNVKGVNHFTWIDAATWDGRDLWPVLEAERDSRRPFPNYEPGDMAEEGFYVDNNEIAHHLFDTFGLFPVAGDRHLAEFVPWYLDIDRPEDVHQWGVRLTPSEHRIESWPEGNAERQALLSGEESFAFEESGEELVDVLRALTGETAMTLNLNLPNEGQVANLPDDAVVETNARITQDEVRPIAAGELPGQVGTLVGRHVSNQETLLEAGMTGDLDLAFQAFVNDPLVSIPATDARAMFTDLVEAERSYLEDHWDLADATVLSNRTGTIPARAD